jgi:hypothetical protein
MCAKGSSKCIGKCRNKIAVLDDSKLKFEMKRDKSRKKLSKIKQFLMGFKRSNATAKAVKKAWMKCEAPPNKHNQSV